MPDPKQQKKRDGLGPQVQKHADRLKAVTEDLLFDSLAHYARSSDMNSSARGRRSTNGVPSPEVAKSQRGFPAKEGLRAKQASHEHPISEQGSTKQRAPAADVSRSTARPV